MVVLIMKKIFLIFLVVSATVLATSSAAQRGRFVMVSAEQNGQNFEDAAKKISPEESEEGRVHERMLRMDTNDYGRYDPSPTLSKPRYKLIPN